MKLREFLKLFDAHTVFTIRENAYTKKTGEFYSFKTVYFNTQNRHIDDRVILDLDIEEDVYVYNDMVNVDVKTYIDVDD